VAQKGKPLQISWNCIENPSIRLDFPSNLTEGEKPEYFQMVLKYCMSDTMYDVYEAAICVR